MIRFSCPGCGATYSVDDSKGGKTGKCPKCQSQFTIPMPEGGAAPAPAAAPPPLPASDASGTVEIAPCPGCQTRLSVAVSDLGSDVECPTCRTVFKATRPGGSAGAVALTDEDERPSRRRRDEEEDERPSRRRGRRDDEEDEDRPSRRRRRDEDDEEEEERPRRRRGRRDYEPHRGVMILMFGILGWAVCLIFGILAWVMGNADLRAMDEGRMDPEGRSLTQIGRILGMIQCILAMICIPVYIVMLILGAAAGN